MLLYQQFFYLLIGLGVLLGLPALWLFSRALWPSMVERARVVASRSLLLNFLCGLPVFGGVIFLATLSGKFRPGVAGTIVALLGLLILWGLVGAAGLAAHIGQRLWPASTGADSWRALWRGGLVLSGVLAIPFLGWYILLLVLITTGIGIRLRMWFARPEAALAPAPAPAAAATTPPAVPQPTP